jgi:ribonuclease P protein component
VTDERFPKAQRLRNRREFLEVQGRGIKVSADCLLALAVKTQRPLTRLGLTVSSKVGNAVVRNRIRRSLREHFRKTKAALPKGLDLVVIAKSSAATATSQQLARAFDSLVGKLSERLK